ncbi:MAG: LamG-like jellyroll fold domain-containing protein [Kiritimatiellia bacterium]
MSSINNNVCGFVRRPRRWLGLLLAGAVTGLAAVSWGVPQDIVLSNAAPHTAFASLINPGYVGTTPTNWVLNVANTVDIDPNIGVEISLETRPLPAYTTIIFSHWSGSLTSEMTADGILNPVVKDLVIYGGGDLTANYTNKAVLRVNSADPAQGSTIPVHGTTTNVPVGRAIAVTAVPATGYDFWYWTNTSGNISIPAPNSATTFVTVNAATGTPTVAAFFRAKKRLTVNTAGGQGLVFMSSSVSLPLAIQTNVYFFNSGETITLTAQGLNGQVFKKWTSISGVGVQDTTAANTTINNMTNDTLVSVEFGVPGPKLIVLTGPNGVTTPSGTNEYVLGSYVDITATASNGYGFYKWTTVNGGAINPLLEKQNPLLNIQMNQDRDFMAIFTNVYTVAVEDAMGPGTGGTNSSVIAGESWMNTPPTAVIAWNGGRIEVAGWTNGTGNVSAGGSGTSVAVANASMNSGFKWVWQQYYSLNTEAQGAGQVFPLTGTNFAWYAEGSTISVTALPDVGYALAGWMVDGLALLHRDLTFTLLMNESKSVVAIFNIVTPDFDNDGLPSWWEEKYGLDPNSTNDPNDGANGDPDGDGLSNMQEFLMAVTNGPGGLQYFMNPINADTDGDGMDDYFEVYTMQPSNAVVGDISAAMIPSGAKGPNGNPDGDFKWDTATGYELLNQPLNNISEWTGADGVAPCTYETVPGNTVFTYNGVARQPVKRRVPAWPARQAGDTDDQTDPFSPDTDNDGFDDGYEYSWDQWQKANQGMNIQGSGLNFWPAITGVVPAWPANRRYNGKSLLTVTPNTLEPDYDWLYDLNLGSVAGAFNDLSEYQASSLFGGSNVYPVVRRVQRPERWCTNPFLWDTDSDGLPDGWEMSFGFDPWSADTDGNGISDAYENPDRDGCAVTGTLFHSEVYAAHGFNPNVGWFADPEKHETWFVNILELVGSAAVGSGGISNVVPPWILGTQNIRSTNPREVDTDSDGMWDGWELYVGLNPVVATDAGKNPDGPNLSMESLLNWQEFIGGTVISTWQSLIAAGATSSNGIQPAWLAFSGSWPNKLLPTDPFNADTDHDQLLDSTEQTAFNYSSNGSVGAGGGLNPCSVDTDLDYLPDAWELYAQGALVTVTNTIITTVTNTVAGTNSTTTITNSTTVVGWGAGMDGTTADAFLDYDGDGLYNYQEYMVGACYQFQWAFNDGTSSLGDPYGSENDPYDFFDTNLSLNVSTYGPGGLRGHHWDPAYWADRMWPEGARTKPFSFLSGVPTGLVGSTGQGNFLDVRFSTCNPGNWDTDLDGYDDYYELYHCLNPIRGDNDAVLDKLPAIYFVPPLLSYDTPYRWGERPSGQVADYDQDGQVDVQENLTPNLDAVQTYSHTDPSPYFVTDVSSDNSYVNRFYKTGNVFGALRYWFFDADVLEGAGYPSAYLFSFEMNEGFDTDNDLISDGDEIIGATGGPTDPLDDDSPLRQRALFVNGVDAAARLYSPTFHSWYSFQAFTVEAWVKPLSLDGDRVIVERAGMVTPGHPANPGASPRVTRNFRLGILDGTPYVSYDGYGEVAANDGVSFTNVTVTASPQFKLIANAWTHLGAIYDPVAKQLMILVNGEMASSRPTEEIPFYGYIGGDPTGSATMVSYGMSVVVGSADKNPAGYCDGTRDNIKSGSYKWGGSPGNDYPVLADHFHGWIDEVHLWDGALTVNQVRYLRTHKLTRALISQINGTQTGNQSFQGDMGGSALNAKLLYAFTFDGLPSPAERVQPLGFERTLQPSGNIAWWSTFPLRSTVYNNYEFVKWIQNMASHQPYDPPRDTRMLRWIVNGTVQNFPNTSNPYTMEYIHGLGGSWENHPQYGSTAVVPFTGLSLPDTPRDYSGVYGDLLPLGGAYGDDSTLMWDGSLPTDLQRDQDGDGVPDVWEELHGLNPFDPLDADSDPDRDGLSTRQEYNHGSDPFGMFSLSQGVMDFFAYTNGVNGPYRFLGEEYTDMDYIDDLWEAAYGLNTEMFDSAGPNADPDNDGWSNLAEFQDLYRIRISGGTNGYLTAATNLLDAFTPLANNDYYVNRLGNLSFLLNQSTNNASNTVMSLEWNDPHDDRFYPSPTLLFRFQYAGQSRALANPRFVVLAYSDRGMETPDASIRGTADRSDTYPRYMALNTSRQSTVAYEGDVREGLNWFWGFMDLNSDNEYQSNEPAGFAGPINIRWGSVGPIDIPLTDRRLVGFARFNWPRDPNAEAYRVTIVDRNVANAPTVFDRTFTENRTFVHEGDLVVYKKLGKGFKRSGGYQFYVRSIYDNVEHVITNGMAYVKYASPIPAPQLIWPLGNARLRQSRDTFVWKMDKSATKCLITVKRRDTGATVLTHSFIPPAVDAKGRSKMEMPIYIGDGVFQNGTYDYTLTVRNPLGSASSTGQFSVKVGDYPGYSYSLSGSFIYPGKVPNGVFVAEAFTSPGFGGVPVGRRLIANTITSSAWPTNVMAFTIRGVPAGTYYVRVFLDQNDVYPNYKADDFESQGWLAEDFYWPVSVEVSRTATTVFTDSIKVLMRDTDNDRLADDWEYRWNTNLTSFGLGDMGGYTPALNGVLNVFQCYGAAPLGVSPF